MGFGSLTYFNSGLHSFIHCWQFLCAFPRGVGLGGMGPSLSEKLFPVNRPSGLKRANWNFFFHNFGNFGPKNQYILVKKKKSHKKNKKISDCPTGVFFLPPGGQETLIHLRMAWRSSGWWRFAPRSLLVYTNSTNLLQHLLTSEDTQ